jgi:hypothetical protein
MGMGTGGIHTTDNIPETTEIFGFPTDKYTRQTDFLKHLILSYSFEIKLNTCKNYRNFNSIYFKAVCRVYCQLWVSHPYSYPYPRKFSCSCMFRHRALTSIDLQFLRLNLSIGIIFLFN